MRARSSSSVPNQVFDLPPGHVTWVEGEEVLEMVDWAGGAGFDPQPGGEARAMATILFTDIVDSTVLAREAGDASWKRTVAMHEDVVRSVLAGFAGREIQTAGDSFLVVFDSVEGAIRCGLALVGALNAIQLRTADCALADRSHRPIPASVGELDHGARRRSIRRWPGRPRTSPTSRAESPW
jgi:class 3 adenylate cyclase